MNADPLTIIAITTAEPGKADLVRAAQVKLVAETLQEDGCLGFALHRSLDDDRIGAFVETWASEAHWRAHMQGEAMQRFQASEGNRAIADFALHRLVKVAG